MEGGAVMTVSALNRLMANLAVPVMRGKNGKGWPEHDEGMRAKYMSLEDAMTVSHKTDAHFTAYSVPLIERRLAGPNVFDKIPEGVPMVLLVVDVDDTEAKKQKVPAREAWWHDELRNLEPMRDCHGGFVYRTRGGYRIVHVVAEPFVLKSTEDAATWKRIYLAWLDHLGATYGIEGDRSCQDWTRLYRLPHVVRSGERQKPTTIGDPENIEAVRYTIPPAPEPKRIEPRNSNYTTKPGAFDIREALAQTFPGAEAKRTTIADNFYVECPWKGEHSSDSGPTETVVFVYPDGKWEFKCLHDHCSHRGHDDLRQWIDPTWKPYDPNAPKKSNHEPPPDIDIDDEVIDESYAPTVDPAEVETLARDPKTNQIYHTQANVMLALRKLGVSVSVDEFARQELIRGLPGFGPRLDDGALLELRLLLDDRFNFRLGKEFFSDVVTRHAWRNRFHPVREYLDGLKGKWDGTPRIDRWLVDYANAPDTNYVLAVSKLFLVAAVRRIREPGCKFDEMPILESGQGTNKSTGLRALAVRSEWFADDLPLDGDTKHLIEQTSGKWIVEAGELKGMNRGDVAKLKACLSRQVDEARLSYGRKNTIAPRQFVIIGTTNENGGYLKDTTGNRRFWPVRIDGFDLESLKRDRDQLWAEAVHCEERGDSIRLDPALYGDAEAEQTAREVDDDPIEGALAEALGGRKGKIRALDIWEILNVEPGKATQDQNLRMGSAMRRLGWERKLRRFDGERDYAYVKGSADEREQAVHVDALGFNGSRTVNVTGGAR
jgi:hypothetical protein